jgi:metallo-beta-lactamase class B
MDAYIASTERMRDLVRAQRIEVLLSNHPSFDGTDAKLAQLRTARAADAPHPFVVGTDAVLRALTVAGECARANKARFELQK